MTINYANNVFDAKNKTKNISYSQRTLNSEKELTKLLTFRKTICYEVGKGMIFMAVMQFMRFGYNVYALS